MAHEVELIDLSSDGDENDVPSSVAPLVIESKSQIKKFVADSSGTIFNEVAFLSDNSSDFPPNGIIKRDYDQSSISSSSAVPSPCLSPSQSSSSSTKEKKGGVSFKSRQFEKLSRKKRKLEAHNTAKKRIKPIRCDTGNGIQNGNLKTSSVICTSDNVKNDESTINQINDILKDENPVQNFVDVLKSLRDKVTVYTSEKHISDLYDQMNKCEASFLISEDFKTTVEENVEHVNYHIDGVQECMFRLVEVLHHHQAKSPLHRPQNLKPLTVIDTRTSLLPLMRNSKYSLLPDSHSRTSSPSVSDTKDSTLSAIPSLSLEDNVDQKSSSSEIPFVPHANQTARKSFPLPSTSIVIPNNHLVENEIEEEGTPEEKEKQKRIAKLDKLLFKICKRIRELQKQEVSWDDEQNSPYIRADRMCNKMVSVCKLLWKENDARFLTGRPIEKKIRYQSTRYTEVNERVERLVNKTKLFPDFQDIFQLVTKTNDDFDLGIPNVDDLARSVFKEIGEKLQKQRIDTYLQHFMEMMEDNESYEDISDENVLKELDKTREEREKKIIEIIDHYATLDPKVSHEKSKEKENSDIDVEFNNENEDDEDNEESNDEDNEESNDEDNVSLAESDDIEILDDEVSVGLDC